MLSVERIIKKLKEKSTIVQEKELAKALNISNATLSNWKKRNSFSFENLNTIIAFSNEHNIDLNWLFSDTLLKAENSDEELISVSYFPDISASAGFGYVNEEFIQASSLKLPKEIFPAINERYVEAIRANGDSMEPTIHDGSVMFVNTNCLNIKNGKIYVIRLNEELFVKRIFNASKANEYIIQSDNELYPKFTLARDEFEVLGELIYNIEKL